MSFISSQHLRSGAALGVALLVLFSPVVASAATTSANTTINAAIGSAITITTSNTVSMSLTPTPGGVVSSANDTVTVNTNNTSGYTLTLADSDANVNLTSGGNNISAHSGTFASPTALGVNTWGYAVAGVGGFDVAYSAESNNTTSSSKWAGVPASGSPATLKTTASVATNDITTVWYGVKVDSSQPGGTYSDTVTYTATTN